MNDIVNHKIAIRKQIKVEKSLISPEEKKRRSKQILELLELDKDFKDAQNVFAYWSMNDEVYTHSFIEKWSVEKSFFLPVIEGTSLVLKLFEGIDKMKKESQYGILQPQGEALENFESIDYAFIPGVAFDTMKNRLGRGKAFYDSILGEMKAVKAGLCFDFQLIDNVPVEETDISMCKVITETKVY